MARRKKRAFDEQSVTTPGWIVTFSDLMTLLLTFFILLYSFSNLDMIKFKKTAEALQSVLSGQSTNSILFDDPAGAGDQPLEYQIPEPGTEPTAPELDPETIEMFDRIQEFVRQNGLSAELEVTYNAKGVLVNISEAVLFESGEADIKEQGKQLLDTIARLLVTIDNEVEVQGHTDDRPIRTDKYPTNWELSVDRSVQVIRYFVEKRRIDPERFIATGFAEYQPLVQNTNSENRAMNRRVNLLIVIDQ